MNNNEILATVGGVEITNADLEAYLANVPQEQRMYAANPQFRNQFLEQLISMYAYAKLAEDMKLDETDEFKRIIANAKRDILAQLAVNETLKGIDVTEDEVHAFYVNNPQHFQKGETVSAKHILVSDEAECKAILESINNGEKTFEAAAKESSTCPSGQKGGDLGEFGKGQMVKEFEDAAFAAEIGVVVGPVQTQFGFHLIKVEEKKDATISPFETEKSAIMKKLMQDKQAAKYAEKVAELREKYLG